MTSSLLLSLITTLVFSVAGIFIWYFLLFKKEETEDSDKVFAWIWLSLSGIVGFMGLRTLFYGLGFIIWDLIFALIDQLFVFIGLSLLGYYSIFRIIKVKKIARIVSFVFFTPLSFLPFAFILNYIWQKAQSVPDLTLDLVRQMIEAERVVSAWGSEFVPPIEAMSVLISLFVIIIFLLILSIVLNIKNIKNIKYSVLLADFSFLIFLASIIFDQSGRSADWRLPLVRLILMISPLVAYFSCCFFNKKINKNL